MDKALEFLPLLERDWVDFVEEIKGMGSIFVDFAQVLVNCDRVLTFCLGIAAGVGGDVGLGDVLALNVRSEIAMGLMTDGCTALSWTAGSDSILAQNWDVSFFSHLLRVSILCVSVVTSRVVPCYQDLNPEF